MHFFLLALFPLILLLTSCDSNLLGDTDFQACEHSPSNMTGLPVNCQVSIPSTEGLITWLDGHDLGTLNLQDQSLVTSWLDKSGQNIQMSLLSGTAGNLNKKSSNDRNAVLLESLATYSAGGVFAGVAAGDSFTMVLSFKIGSLNENSLSFNNGEDFSFTTNSSNELIYSAGTQTAQTTGFNLSGKSLINLIISYSAPSKIISFQDSGNSFSFSKAATPEMGAWSDLQLSGQSTNINEIIIYNKLVDSKSLQTYLNNKWGF